MSAGRWHVSRRMEVTGGTPLQHWGGEAQRCTYFPAAGSRQRDGWQRWRSSPLCSCHSPIGTRPPNQHHDVLMVSLPGCLQEATRRHCRVRITQGHKLEHPECAGRPAEMDVRPRVLMSYHTPRGLLPSGFLRSP